MTEDGEGKEISVIIIPVFSHTQWYGFPCHSCLDGGINGLQSVNTRIYSEWLPGNPDYELCGNPAAEWYDCVNGEMTDLDYHSAIWVRKLRSEGMSYREISREMGMSYDYVKKAGRHRISPDKFRTRK